MLLYMYEHKILIYATIALCGIGILSKLVLTMVYSRLVKSAREMGNSENKLMKVVRLKFDTCYKMKLSVHNVDSFVDKYVYSHKFCGISLYTWENFGGQLLILCGLIALFGGVGAQILECGQQVVLSTIVVGGLAIIMLIACEPLLVLPAKRHLLRIHMKDYLQNNLQARLENQYIEQPVIVPVYQDRIIDKSNENAEIIKDQIEKVEKKQTQNKTQDEKIIEEILKEYLV